jgi:hypothetical protein
MAPENISINGKFEILSKVLNSEFKINNPIKQRITATEKISNQFGRFIPKAIPLLQI